MKAFADAAASAVGRTVATTVRATWVAGWVAGLAAGLVGPGAASPAQAGAFVPPQEVPALRSAQAAQGPLLAVTRAGGRIVAVGLRGHIVYSDDAGATWQQAAVPVSSDLLGVCFPTPQHGWAVGQGGVVLHSSDAGAHWTRQLAGQQASELALRFYAATPQREALFEREKRLAAGGGTQALLDVYFENERTGYVVGTFNRIFRTDDAGASWVPWMDHTDNPDELHFYAIRGGPGGLYLAGEQGMVWRLDAATQRFNAIPTPYKGTLFGLVMDGTDRLLVFGMRGSLFRSDDQGKTWARLNMASAAGITGGAVLPDGALLLVNQAGGIDVSRDHGQSFRPLQAAAPMPYFAVTALDGGRVGLVGAAGARTESLRPDASK